TLSLFGLPAKRCAECQHADSARVIDRNIRRSIVDMLSNPHDARSHAACSKAGLRTGGPGAQITQPALGGGHDSRKISISRRTGDEA
ncbi:MAG: hypothetical protein K2X32_14690, partial [Phycisphaerales bacterium]|nr:hypothetical protein [Phycisphaerales bacterium]